MITAFTWMLLWFIHKCVVKVVMLVYIVNCDNDKLTLYSIKNQDIHYKILSNPYIRVRVYMCYMDVYADF